MPESIRRDRRLTSDESARLKSVRAEFAGRPSQAQLLTSGEYVGPMSLEEFLSWRASAGDAPLAKQLLAAIGATKQSLHAIAKASDVAPPVLQRFVNGERGITLETAGKLAAYLGLSLLPSQANTSRTNT